MLKYVETNWQSEEGLETHDYQISFEEVKSQSTIEEQEKRPERLSLVKFFDGSDRTCFFDICRHIQKNDEGFYFDKFKRFHTTLLGFPVVEPEYYDTIAEKIKQYSERTQGEMNVKFDLIRLGTKYENNKTLKPVKGTSNGTIIAVGDTINNKGFTTLGNNLASFLSNDQDLNPVLGNRFRRRFPTVWCTMGYFTRDFMITSEVELLFNDYRNLDQDQFRIPCYDLELGTSCYKDLRDWKRVKRFSLS
jgi:hypothetical protein